MFYMSRFIVSIMKIAALVSCVHNSCDIANNNVANVIISVLVTCKRLHFSALCSQQRSLINSSQYEASGFHDNYERYYLTTSAHLHLS